MAYQLIYTSAARLLDSPLSGYGVVARSEQMPPELIRRLVHLSAYKEPADVGISGPQCTYSIEECADRVWHILTCTRAAGPDYSQRNCHLAHHIILSDAEAQVYAELSTGQPTTPAGIMLALEQQRFWQSRWQRDPEIIDDDDFPLPLECPSSEFQPTWHIFSGHPDNAHALGAKRYGEGCLMLVPKGTQSRDVLSLLHEGSALMPEHGWGMTFCSYSVDTEPLTGRRIIVTTPESGLHQAAREMGFPTLDIRPGMQEAPDAAPQPRQEAAPESPLNALPILQNYHYTEAPDDGTFPTPWSHTQSRGLSATAKGLIRAGVVAGVVGVSAALLYPHLKRPAARERELPRTPEITQPADDTPPPLPELPAEPPQQVDDTPPAPPLPELPDEPPQQVDDTPPAPPLPELPAEPPQRVDDTPPAPEQTPPEQPSAPEPSAAEPEEPPPAAPQITERSLTAILENNSGVLPRALLHMHPGQEQLLEVGEYMVHVTSREGNFGKLYMQTLKPGSGLKLARTGEGEYTLSPQPGTPEAQEIPTVRLLVDSVRKRLRQIVVNGQETAAVRLPLRHADGLLEELLLVPQISLHIRPVTKRLTASAAPAAELRLSRAMLRTEGNKLTLARPEKAPARQSWQFTTEAPINLTLPELGLSIRPEVKQAEQDSYVCRLSELSPNTYLCLISQEFRPWSRIRARFEQYVNQPCLGLPEGASATPEHSLARVYALLTDMAASKVKSGERFGDLVVSYAMLYRHPIFGEQLRTLFSKLPHPKNTTLTVSAQTADDLKPSNAKLLLRDLRTELQVSANQQHMLAELLKHFSLRISEDYTALYKQFAADVPRDLYLRLTEVHLAAKKRLICTFELIHP